MLDQWVETTLEWEDADRIERLRYQLWREAPNAGQAQRDKWSAEYIGWTFAGPASHRQIRQGQVNGRQGGAG
ncbi:MAG: hypothetical protein ACE5F6_11565 [Anaerolineae bacterium]